MNQESESACKFLEGTIGELFQKGIIITDGVRHYIDSTFSCSCPETLEKILNDESDIEKEPLIELLFFPDESFQVQLESILGSFTFENEDVEKIQEYLIRNTPVIKFQDNKGCMNFNFPIPKWAAARFIYRLNICKKLNPLILQAVNTHVKSSLINLVKVKLRNSRFIDTDKKVYFLCNFFKSIDSSDDELLQIFDFILNFLDEISDDVTIFKALIQRKKSLFKNLHQAMKFEEQLKNNNMEILLLQGVRAPHINPDETRKKMGYIDKICVSVFGRTEHLEQVYSSYREYDDNTDVQEIVQVLS